MFAQSAKIQTPVDYKYFAYSNIVPRATMNKSIKTPLSKALQQNGNRK